MPGARVHDGHGCCQDQQRARRRTLIGFDSLDLRAMVLELRCRSWRCVCCRWSLCSRNRARAIRGAIVDGHRTFFVTLTLDLWSEAFQAELERHRGADGVLRVREAGGRQLTGDEAWQQLTIRHASSSWNRLRTALLRRPEFRDGFEFYRALEVTQRGVAHLHVLIRRPGTSPWLIHYGVFRGLLDAAGFGRVTDVQRVSGGDRAAQYVTKATAAYTAKGAMQELPRWTRRGTWSRGWNAAGWVRPTRIAGFRWQLGAAGAPFTAEALRASGFELVDPASCRVPASSAGSGGGGGGGTATRV